MSVFADILNILGTIQECFFLYRLVDLMYEKRSSYFREYRRSRIMTWIMIGTMTLVVLGFNQVALTSPYTASIVFIQGIVCISLFWNCDVHGAIAVTGGYFLLVYIIGGTEVAVTGLIGGESLIYATTMENGIVRVIYLMILLPLHMGINQVIYIWLRKRMGNWFGVKYILMISVVGVIGCTFIAILMLSSFNIVINMVWFVLMLVISVVIFARYYVVKSRYMQEQLRQVNAQNAILERNYEQLRDFYSTNAKLYHDMNHHLNAMYYMLQKGEKEQAKEYIESIKEPIDTFAVKLRTGIDVLDVILYDAERRAQEKNVLLQMEISKLPQNIMAEKKDLCALLANLLDNALEAAQKEIKILVKMVQRQLLIQVQNDYLVEVVREKGHFVTTKSDKRLHGLGIQSIESVVQKYNGSMEYKIQDYCFNVDIMISI